MTKKPSQKKQPINNEKRKAAFGDYIRKHRKKMSLTQQDLADALGITKKSVCSFESGATFPSQENIFRLSETLNMSLDEFLYGEKIFEHDICIDEINQKLSLLSDKEQGMVISLLNNAINIITGCKS